MMDPTGGMAGKGLIALAVIVALLWIFAPWAWAAGISLALAIGFFALLLFILSNARYT